MTSDQLLDQGSEKPIDVASAWLLAQLSSGRKPATDLQIAATLHSITETTLKRAKTRLGIVSVQEGSKWYWTRTDTSDGQFRHCTQNDQVTRRSQDEQVVTLEK